MEARATAGGSVRCEGGRVWIEGVPPRHWGQGHDCTFAGCLEAALAPTRPPWTYSDLMGVSGLAFRFRWSNRDTRSGWTPACACGEFHEEYTALQRATGWSLPAELHSEQPDWEAIRAAFVASIDAGLAVMGQFDDHDVNLAFGYEDEGRALILRHYSRPEDEARLPLETSQGFRIYLGEPGHPAEPVQALVSSLELGVLHWGRGLSEGHSGWYDAFYGEAGFDAWCGDLESVDPLALDEAEGQRYYSTNCFAYFALVDARRSAAVYLRDHAGLLPEAGKSALLRAADLYDDTAIRLAEAQADGVAPNPYAGAPIAAWTLELRRRQAELLQAVKGSEALAAAALRQALGTQL